MLQTIRDDYRSYGLTPWRAVAGIISLSPFWLVVAFRIAHLLQRRRVPVAPSLIHAAAVVIWSADISPSAEIGPGFVVSHSVGIVVGPGVRAGARLQLFQNVTLGSRSPEKYEFPTLGEDVTIYAGAAVLGGVRLGDGVSVGANAVVICDVPPRRRAVGIPARILD